MSPFRSELLSLLRGAGEPQGRWELAALEVMGRLSQETGQVWLLDRESLQPKHRSCKDQAGKTRVRFKFFPFFFLFKSVIYLAYLF